MQGNNPKAVAAKEKKADAKEREEAQKLKQSEDEQWAAAGEGAKSKAQAKKDEQVDNSVHLSSLQPTPTVVLIQAYTQAKQREEANAKKAEAKRLAAEEEAAVTAKKPAKAKVSAPKVTSHQLQLEREARQRETQKEQEQRKREQKREVRPPLFPYPQLLCKDTSSGSQVGHLQVAEDSYEQLIGTPNMNRAEGDGIEARSVGAALSALDLGGDAEEDRHPERCSQLQTVSVHA